ncbi:FtsW/RodA/SpoVE family cell cycle protein [Jeotgalibacillus sp. S-D1]|uniref:FtsW/RodA/SpoVE family cell cycle protein n=1 Tax=Jeotgalibacillus sp. S-D1 TaxID=2552189 RepID=UPI001059BBB8|nr:FtsW/RodA/SpoVE family cell cycle protein [Jeotgalibacillus sp. S-D1]TDL32681.1 FtsW/RodA/SpoVE family cell cycle protein [Jeotgalibacillus sp. S-D1]
MNKKSDLFLKEVTNNIKSKEAKRFVSDELRFHLTKAKNTWKDKGLSENEAEDRAVQQMGNPSKLGQELNKLHRPKIDWFILILLAAVLGLSFVPVLSLGNAGTMDVNHFLMNKGMVVILGTAVALGVMVIDFRRAEKLGFLFYFTGAAILLMIHFFSNSYINGQAFIQIGPITIEALMALPFFYLAWASFFADSRLKLWQLGLLYLLPLYLFFLLPNLTAPFLYSVMVFIMVWWSGMVRKNKLLITFIPLSAVLIAGLFFWYRAEEYQLNRIMGFMNPQAQSEGAGFIYIRLSELFSAAGWFGAEGNAEFIPAAHTDFVFVSLTYYHGYLFALVLLMILSLLAVRMLGIANKLSGFGKLLVIGAMTLYLVQLIFNIGMVLGFLPITSIALPFISYGLMPTMLNAFMIGIVLSVYRRKHLLSPGFV